MLKLIAFSTMLIDHIGYAFFPRTIVFRAFGRLAFPLFAWGIARGIKSTGSFRRYALRVFVLALVSQYPYSLFSDSLRPNVCFTLLAGMLSIKIWEISKNKVWGKAGGVIGITALGMLVHFLEFEYGVYGMALVTSFYYINNLSILLGAQLVVTLGGIWLYRYNPLQILALVAIPLIYTYSEFKIKLPRPLVYAFYPVHLLILFFLSQFL